MTAANALNAGGEHPPVVADEGSSLVELSIPASKRVLDVVVAISLLVLASPLIIAISLVVRRDGGPVLLSQRRVGQGGRIIEIKKFRSMAVDAEARLHSDPALYARYVANGFKLRANEDPRLTRSGRRLRSTKPRRAAPAVERGPGRDEHGRAPPRPAA